MPPYSWPTDPGAVVRQFEALHPDPEAGALLSWGVWAVDSLHYLDEVDVAYDASPVGYRGHDPAVVDVSHARWATGTCITSVDLCAAALGRVFCRRTGRRELALADFNPKIGDSGRKRRAAKMQAMLPTAAVTWVDAVLADSNYGTVKDARDLLTHARIPRHFTLIAGGPPQRLSLGLSAGQLPVRQIVEFARDVATRHMTALVGLLPAM